MIVFLRRERFDDSVLCVVVRLARGVICVTVVRVFTCDWRVRSGLGRL